MGSSPHVRLAAAFAALAAPLPFAAAQSTPFLRVPGLYDQALELAGDLNADGVEDVIVGLPVFGAQVLSLVDGTVLLSLTATPSVQDFGHAVAGVGDVNGDGVPDLAVGGPEANGSASAWGAGRAEVLSGVDGALLYGLDGTLLGDRLGEALSPAGDVDGDGVPDVLIGAPGSDLGVPDGGLVLVLSGASGAVLHSIPGDRHDYSLGTAVSNLGDVNGDGRDDFIASSRGNVALALDDLVYVFSGLDGSVLYRLDSPKDYDLFGFDLAPLGDVDLDGAPDFVVGSPTNGARARVFSGADGSLIHKVFNGGYSVSGIGDYDGDGYADFVSVDEDDNTVATNGGQVSIYSGKDKSLLDEFFGNGVSSYLGRAVAAGLDVNSDGKPDLVALEGVYPGSTSVNVYLGGTSQIASYCTAGVSASGCSALLGASGTPSASAGTGFLVSASGVEGGKNGLFFFGVNGRQAQPWSFGSGFQCVVPPVQRGALIAGSGTSGVCDGTFSNDLNARWAAKPGQNPGAGSVAQIQLWYRDPSATGSTSLSDAIEVTVAP